MTVIPGPGIQVSIKIPSTLPSWVSPAWEQYLRNRHQTIATIKDHPRPGKSYGWPNPAPNSTYFVSLIEYPDWGFAMDWLLPLTAPYKIPCNCPLTILMNRGCQNLRHQ